MFCNQCEQTAKGHGCTVMGVCGKSAEVAGIQDAIIYAARGLAVAALAAAPKGGPARETGRLCVRALFSTITNVNFDKEPLLAMLRNVVTGRDALMKTTGLSANLPVLRFTVPATEAELLEEAKGFGTETFAPDADRNSLAQTLLFGLKGAAAYADHAAVLGVEDEALYEAFYKGLAFGFDGNTPSLDEWVAAVLACGQTNLKAMELLDTANTDAYGHPVPTEVSLAPREGKAILVTGHDLKDLHELLIQTEGKGINIYTHGEMLPAHAYPELKAFGHFAGHFGTAWQNQQKEFPSFPGPILFTTNCIQKPQADYADRVFTTGLVGWPGIKHVANGDFGPVVNAALAAKGYSKDDAGKAEKRSVMTGFARNAVLGVAETVVNAVKSGAIRHFFLVGGCDGAKSGRNYYTELVEKTPADTIVLTLACGKFRFFDKQLGSIGGIPRLLDVGQCNDAYSAVKIALALAEAFDCGVNDLPLSLVLSWYEQKAVAVLLTLLSLGIKNIRLGPTLPAFVTPAVLDVLVKNFGIMPVTTPDEDLKAMLG